MNVPPTHGAPSREQRMTTLRTVCGALVSSVVVISLAPFTGFLEAQPEQGEAMVLPIAIVAAVSIFASQVFRGFLFRPKKTGDRGRDEIEVWNKLLVSTIVSFAILESVAILGMVLFLFSGNIVWPLVYGGVAFMVMLGSWPTQAIVDKALSDA